MGDDKPTGKTYTCALCGETFGLADGWTEDDAVQEYRGVFGESPTPEDSKIVCDDCYKKIMAFHGH